MENLVVVNENDEETGVADKLECHKGEGILHRAFTVFIFNHQKQLLTQKRSEYKLLWPLTWESSCSSHPLPKDEYIAAGQKRLEHELGFSCSLEMVGKFQYEASYKNIGSENEVCALLIGEYDGDIRVNNREVKTFKWIDLETLEDELSINSSKYAPWLKSALECYKDQNGDIPSRNMMVNQ